VSRDQSSAKPVDEKVQAVRGSAATPLQAGTVLAIFGPTGVGKTGVAVELAELLRERGEDPVAISCDALQVYEGLGTLTGVASAEEQAKLEHRLVGFVPLSSHFSVGDYMPLAHAEIDKALEAGRRPIVVGGTGLYLRAALAELSLVKAEPESEDSELWSPDTRHPTTIFGLDMDREELYRRIDARTEAIVAAGAREEVLRAEGLEPSRTACVALGFDELLSGDVETMKQRSRNYARRQLTWMRKIPNLRWIDRGERDDAEAAAMIALNLDRCPQPQDAAEASDSDAQ
jgi:tRNA dimethylallyltransferase